MKNILIIPMTFLFFPVFAQSEEAAVKEVVTSAYINSIHNGGPIENIRNGFHPSFHMLRFAGNNVNPLSIEDWIKNIEKSRAENPNNTPVKTEGKFINVTVAGNTANVVLELFKGDKKIFTDNLLLYKFDEGWRIVSKTYYRHP